MTDPRLEEDVQIPLRMESVVARPEGWRGRSVNVIAVGLVAFVAVGVLLGAMNIGGPQRLPPLVLATEEPTQPPRTERPSQRPTIRPVPTSPPLPAHLVLGDELPSERRLVYANGLQTLDMASGELGPPLHGYDGNIVSLGGEQFVCACLIRDEGNPAVARGLKFARVDFDGQVIVERDLAIWDDVEAVRDMTEGVTVQLALVPDQKRLYILATARRPPSWTVDLLAVDLTQGELLGSRRIAELPVDLEEELEPSPSPSAPINNPGSPPDGYYAWAQGLAVTPSGSTAMVSVNYSKVLRGEWIGTNREWMVPLEDDAAGIRPLEDEVLLPPEGWCYGRPQFVDSIATIVCTPAPGESPGTSFVVRRIGIDGQSAGWIDLGDDLANYYPTPVIHPPTRTLYIWNPSEHSMSRTGLEDGSKIRVEVPERDLPGERSYPGASYIGAEPSVVLSPDGRRLYAIGVLRGDSEVGASSGVWVFDAASLELLDHWPAPAFFISLAVSADGRFVYASGAPNHEPSGRQSSWPSSMTVYDAENGQVEVIHGQVGRDFWLSLPTL